MQRDVVVEILGLVVATFLGVTAIMSTSDDQMLNWLLLDSSSASNAPDLLQRLRLVFRVAVLLALLIAVLGVYLLTRRWRGRNISPTVDAIVDDSIEIVSAEDAIAAAIERLQSSPAPQRLIIWGYSLGWAARLSQYIEGTAIPRLTVDIFVTEESSIGVRFSDPKAEERKAVLRLRLGEWKQLADLRRLQRVHIYAHPFIPHDLGLMIDNDFAIIHSYDWDVSSGRIAHSRQSGNKRRFLQISAKGALGSYLIEQLDARFLCRIHDSPKL
ncbi:hypothetical protein [Mycolicibacterium bacteremicum]|uniref:hypothetical protein n=1 Tax=Mycolicibacterium bacteremicum TaxID=564198 RepID=UPI001056B943|nr:hypothetical protein [Mycolicibacterium bacteremicum]MCV7434919.1 hypothetical protein [Mycolicibacterium bacteremicum]